MPNKISRLATDSECHHLIDEAAPIIKILQEKESLEATNVLIIALAAVTMQRYHRCADRAARERWIDEIAGAVKSTMISYEKEL